MNISRPHCPAFGPDCQSDILCDIFIGGIQIHIEGDQKFPGTDGGYSGFFIQGVGTVIRLPGRVTQFFSHAFVLSRPDLR